MSPLKTVLWKESHLSKGAKLTTKYIQGKLKEYFLRTQGCRTKSIFLYMVAMLLKCIQYFHNSRLSSVGAAAEILRCVSVKFVEGFCLYFRNNKCPLNMTQNTWILKRKKKKLWLPWLNIVAMPKKRALLPPAPLTQRQIAQSAKISPWNISQLCRIIVWKDISCRFWKYLKKTVLKKT